MDQGTLFDWTTEHRLLFADTVDALGEEHAGDATLCEGWDVRTLAGHILQPILVPSPRFLLTAARHRSMARACDVIAADLGARPLAEITAQLRRHAADRVTPWFVGATGPFTDTCIHLRDLAQPQGLDVTVPVERWVAALDIIVSPRGRAAFVPVKGMLDGVSWRATDADWASGEGPEVRGSAEALAMVISGRPAYLDQLDGEGVALLPLAQTP